MLQIYMIRGLPEQVHGRHLIKIIKYKDAISGSREMKILGDSESNLGHDLHMIPLTTWIFPRTSSSVHCWRLNFGINGL